MNSSRISEAERFADSLVKGAALELYLTPKPGLVDLADCGSHPDLTLPKMERSLHIISHYLIELLRSVADGESFPCQAAVGKRAEEAMLDELGTNTHKGYIFLSGLLLVARWHALSSDERSLREKVASLARNFFEQQGEGATHGRQARARYGAGGIVREAMNGLPALFDAAVPAYRETFDRRGCFQTASFAMLARLMQTVEDTTALHRCGAMGLARIRRDGRLIETIIARGDDCVPFLQAINRDYIRLNLTMGGVADMLGLSYGYLAALGCLAGVSEKQRPEGTLLPSAPGAYCAPPPCSPSHSS